MSDSDRKIGNRVPRPAQFKSNFQSTGDAILLETRPRSGVSWFLAFWLVGWTVGCVALIGMFISEPSFFTLLFAVPFWAAWFAVAGFLAWCWFGRETLLLQRDQIVFRRKALITLATRQVPMSEIQGIRGATSNYEENGQYLHGIEVDTVGKPIRFGFRIPNQERTWLISELQDFVNEHGSTPMPSDSPYQSPVDDRPDGVPVTRLSSVPSGQPLNFENTRPEPPSDANWLLEDRVEGPEFSRRGRFSLSSTAFTLFLCCFWNGIVGVFVCVLLGVGPGAKDQPQGGEWWFLFFFLIPFEALGLVFLAAFLGTIAEPFRKAVWHIQHSELVSETRWPLFSFKGRWRTDDIGHLELRRADDYVDSDGDLNSSSLRLKSPGNADFNLVFVGRDGTDKTRITDATEGEALWMAHVLMSVHRPWRD